MRQLKAYDAPEHAEKRRFLAHNLIAGVGTIGTGVLGFALQSALSHQFRPVDYGAAFAVLTLFNLVSLPTGAFNRLISWSTSRELALHGGRTGSSAALLRGANRRLFLLGLILGVAIGAASPFIGSFMHVPWRYLLAGAVGLPFTMAMPVLVGELQGEQRFESWAAVIVALSAARLVAAVGFGLVLGPTGVLLGISVSAAVIYFGAWASVRSRIRGASGRPDWAGAMRYTAVVLPSTLAMTFLMSADVLLAKHYFNARVAGQYAAVAVLGRAMYWGMTGVASVLFPKVASIDAKGQSAARIVMAGGALAAISGVTGLAVFTFGGKLILSAFAGRGYGAGAAYLGMYALGMAFLGASFILVNAHQSLGRASVLWVLGPFTILEPLLIVLFHSRPMQVVQVLDLTMGGLLVALTVLYIAEERISGRLRLANSAQVLDGAFSTGTAHPTIAIVEPADSVGAGR